MAVYLAIDVGETKTECLIADETKVLARTTAEMLNLSGGEQAAEAVLALIRRIGDEAGVPVYLINHCCCGLAGGRDTTLRDRLEAMLRSALMGDLQLADSEELALEAAFGPRAGVLVFADERSFAIGRCLSGARFRAGGWGPVLGDEGSAHWIGVEAVRSGLRAWDRGLPSCLLREAQTLWRTAHVQGLLAKAGEAPPPRFSALLNGVGRCFTQGDTLARNVLERAGEELATQVSTVCARMRAAGCAEEDTARVALSGSVFRELPAVRHALHGALQALEPQAAVDVTVTEPVEGALLRLRRG